MNATHDPPPSPEPYLSQSKTQAQKGSTNSAGETVKGNVKVGSAPWRTSALRRRRLQLAHYLRLVASLSEEADEMRAEISHLEFIIGAQAETIEALHRQINNYEK